MPSVTTESREHDHKIWINNIERWRYDLKVWDGHREAMLEDARSVLTAVERFIQDSAKHDESLPQLEHCIATCERNQSEPHDSDDAIVAAHRSATDAHAVASQVHSGLEELRHNLMTALSAIKS